MSINLDNYPEFKNDIQGRDTALVPIVKIGEIYVSTNSMNYGSQQVLPLLTSSPSLKESIDIEKRNYKISNISLTLSNFPYEGVRFSDRVTGSLMNESVEVYWTSPSTTNYSNALKIYRGQVRRYDHDDTKCRITVEDRSQATLHKDLPLPENYLGTGDDVPDKYKGKPIPMVYGHVDKSPCVVNSTIGTSSLQVDSEPMLENQFLSGTNAIWGDNISTLDMFVDDEYVNVYYNQFSISNNKILFIINDLLISERLYCKRFYKPKDIGVIDEPIENSGTNLINALDNINNIIDSNINTSEAFSMAHDNMIPDGDFTIYSVGNIHYNISPVIGFYTDFDFDFENDGGDFVILSTEEYYGLDYDNPIRIYSAINQIKMPYNQDIIFISEDCSVGQQLACQTGFTISGIDPVTGSSADYDLSSLLGFGNDSTSDIVIGGVTSSGEGDAVGSFGIVTKGEYFGSQHSITFWNNSDDFNNQNNLASWDINILLKEIDAKAEFVIDKIFTKDFYANVNGRKNTNGYLIEDSPQIIGHIISEISDISVTSIANQAVIDGIYNNYPLGVWKYAFTVDKKINSKKLIENIASASPYIPRFDNMGNFKFTEIPTGGGTADETILDADVIDFSFSRTKIEDVYTKIVFKYNYDYARGEFSDSTTVYVEDVLGSDYNNSYYGLPDPVQEEDGSVTHAESTLIIDDDRGKYIRDRVTAQKFADWFLLWSCNQHIKMKVKLPLKYMNLEIGDFVDFDKVLGGISPYGIDYVNGTNDWIINGQLYYPNFLITSTNKTLEWVEIEAIMMHDLDTGAIYGCMSNSACNFNPDATTPMPSLCDYGTLCPDGSSECNAEDCPEPSEECTEGFGCDSVCGSGVDYDCCGNCGGDSSSCGDCAGVPCGNTPEDECGVCDGDGSTCAGCQDPLASNASGSINDCTYLINPNTGEYYPTATGCCNFNNCTPRLKNGEITSLVNGSNVGINNCSPFLNCNLPFTPCDVIRIDLLNSDTFSAYSSYIYFVENNNLLFLLQSRMVHEVLLRVESGSEVDGEDEVINIIADEKEGVIEHGDTFTSVGYFYSVDGEEIFKINSPVENQEYLINFIFTITTNDGLTGDEITYEEIVPVTFTYKLCSAPGDMNADGGWNVLDIVALRNCVLGGDAGFAPCAELPNGCAGDLNGDGGFNVLDIVTLVHCVMAGNCGG